MHPNSTCRSRQAQLAEKRERKAAEKAAEAAFARAWALQLEDMKEEEVITSTLPISPVNILKGVT